MKRSEFDPNGWYPTDGYHDWHLEAADLTTSATGVDHVSDDVVVTSAEPGIGHERYSKPKGIIPDAPPTAQDDRSIAWAIIERAGFIGEDNDTVNAKLRPLGFVAIGGKLVAIDQQG